MARPAPPGSWLDYLTGYRVTSWVGRAAVAAAFLVHALGLVDKSWAQGGHVWPALVPAPSFVFGLVEGLRYLTIVVQMVGAALLFAPGCTAVGALMLSGTAFVALFAHVFIPGGHLLGSLILFLASAAIVGRRRRELIALWRFHTRSHRAALVPLRHR
jgi:hypothetical protein